ncbi:MAG: LicD family protein [Acetatifactor sp.]|nr:LicD family protein [Acetatifactor sp.]
MNVETRQLQNILLEMFKELHIICEENQIKYFMLGGTCLGAKRHKGFIPWDDDIDIGLYREDYEKLCSLNFEKLSNNLELRYYKNTDNSPMHFVKIVNKNTTLIEDDYKNYVEGIYIDVFPIDNIAYEKYSERFRAFCIRRVHSLIINHCKTDSADSFFRNVYWHFSKKLNLNNLHKILEHLMLKKQNQVTGHIANFLGAWGTKEIMRKECLGTPTLYKFEDGLFYGPERIEEYLKHLYNDYMILPPINKRTNTHDYYYVDFDKPFHEYIEEERA